MGDIFSTGKVAIGSIDPDRGIPCIISGVDGITNVILLNAIGEMLPNMQIDQSLSGELFATLFGTKMASMPVQALCVPAKYCCPGVNTISLHALYTACLANGGKPKEIMLVFSGNRFKCLLNGISILPYTGGGEAGDVPAYKYTLNLLGRPA